MPSHDYIPQRDPELSGWAQNIKTELPAYSTQLGFTDAEETQAIAAAQAIMDAIATANTAKYAAQAATTAKKTAVSTNVGTLRTLFKRGKTASTYTAAVGDALHIVGSESVADWSTFEPYMKVEARHDHVTISFNKGQADGVNVYARAKGAPAWTKLAFDSTSPYIDNRPIADGTQAEVREYRCIAVLDDEEVGLPSGTLAVSFGD